MKEKKTYYPTLTNDSKDYYVQSNRFIQAKYKEALTFIESLLVAKMCQMIQPDDIEFKDYRIYFKDLLSDIGKTKVGGTTYIQIYEAAEKLRSREIQIRSKDEKDRPTRINTTIATSTEELENDEDRAGEEAYITLTFHPKLKPYLLQLKQDFTRINLDIYQKIHASHAIRLYHIFSSYLGRGQRKVFIDVDELKEMLGIAGKYDNFTMFKKYVLDDSQEKLVKDTELNFTYEVKKRGKTVVGIEFSLSQKEKKPVEKTTQKEQRTVIKKTEYEDVIDNKDKLFLDLSPIVISEFGVSPSTFLKLLESHTEGAFAQAIEITRQTALKGKVENLSGFFIKALQDGYKDPKQVKAQQEAEKKAKAKAAEAENRKKQEQQEADRRVKAAQENAEIITFLEKNKDFELIVLGKYLDSFMGRNGSAKTISDIFQNPMYQGAFLGIAKEALKDYLDGQL